MIPNALPVQDMTPNALPVQHIESPCTERNMTQFFVSGKIGTSVLHEFQIGLIITVVQLIRTPNKLC
jgi:hypothetical protein